MATFTEVKDAFNALEITKSPEDLRAEYAEYRIVEKEVFGGNLTAYVCRDIYQFDEQFLGVEWSIPREGYTEEQVPPGTRAYPCEKHVLVTYTEIV